MGFSFIVEYAYVHGHGLKILRVFADRACFVELV